LIRQLRTHLDELMKRKIQHPEISMTSKNNPVLDAIIRLLLTSGF
jgi:hypothetical protein